MTFNETQKGGTINLYIYSTLNVLSSRAPRGRPHKGQSEIDSIREKNLTKPYKKVNFFKTND